MQSYTYCKKYQLNCQQNRDSLPSVPSSHLHRACLVCVRTKLQFSTNQITTLQSRKKPRTACQERLGSSRSPFPLSPNNSVSCFLSAPPSQNSRNIHLYCPEGTNQASHSRRQPSPSSKDSRKSFCCLNRPPQSVLNKNIQEKKSSPTKSEGEVLPELAASKLCTVTPAQQGKSSHSRTGVSGGERGRRRAETRTYRLWCYPANS